MKIKRKQAVGFKAASVWLVLLLGFIISEGIAAEPNNIGELLKEKGLEWLTGKWETTTDKGEKAQAEFALDMNDYVVCVNVKVEGYEYRGLMFFVPSKRSIVNPGADNRGGSFSGSCEIEADMLVMNLEQMTADGAITKFTRYLSKVDADTMKSVTYVFENGKRPEEPTGILEFKRKK